VPLILDGLVGGPNSYPTHVASRLNFRVMKPTTASLTPKSLQRKPIHMRFSATFVDAQGPVGRWSHGQNPWSGSWWHQCKSPACFGRVHRLLCGNSSQVQDFHKGETSTRLLPASQVVTIPCSWIRRDRHRHRAGGGTTGLLESWRPIIWLAIHAEALIEHATFRQISWWGCQIGRDVPRCDWHVVVEGDTASCTIV